MIIPTSPVVGDLEKKPQRQTIQRMKNHFSIETNQMSYSKRTGIMKIIIHIMYYMCMVCMCVQPMPNVYLITLFNRWHWVRVKIFNLKVPACLVVIIIMNIAIFVSSFNCHATIISFSQIQRNSIIIPMFLKSSLRVF